MGSKLHFSEYFHLPWSEVVIPLYFLGWRFNSPIETSLQAICLPCIWQHSSALKSILIALGTFNYTCSFSCFIPSSNGTSRDLFLLWKFAYERCENSYLLKPTFWTSSSDKAETYEFGQKLYNYEKKYWEMQYLKLIDKPIGRKTVSLQSKMKMELLKETGMLNWFAPVLEGSWVRVGVLSFCNIEALVFEMSENKFLLSHPGALRDYKLGKNLD